MAATTAKTAASPKSEKDPVAEKIERHEGGRERAGFDLDRDTAEGITMREAEARDIKAAAASREGGFPKQVPQGHGVEQHGDNVLP